MDTAFRKECCLKRGCQIKIPIAYLPDGDFVYPVKIINPFKEESELIFTISTTDNLLSTKRYCFNSDKSFQALYFSTSNEGCRDIEITIALRKGSMINLHLPVSPRLNQRIKTIPSTLHETIGKIENEIDLKRKSVGDLSRVSVSQNGSPERSVATHNAQPILIESLSPFNGIINLEQAQRQLDYVVYNKMFSTNGKRGLKKIKLLFYRKLLTALYRRLSKNSTRKAYFAKLYRNYINNNIIAENLQAQ